MSVSMCRVFVMFTQLTAINRILHIYGIHCNFQYIDFKWDFHIGLRVLVV